MALLVEQPDVKGALFSIYILLKFLKNLKKMVNRFPQFLAERIGKLIVDALFVVRCKVKPRKPGVYRGKV